jgi:cytoskeletal protein CcmA (bactofilin family)
MKKSTIFTLCLMSVISILNGQRLEAGKDIIITQAVYENLYTAGENITINAPVYGDLVIAGGNITINDTIQKDILLAGGTVIFNGYAGDDVRCAGGNLFVKKDIKGDLVITGGTVVIDKNVTISGNLLVSGGDITLNGTVKGNIRGAFGKFTMNGVIEKDMDCKGANLIINGSVMGKSVLSAMDIEIGDNAAFNDNVRYWNKKGSLDVKQAVKKGQVMYDPSLKVETGRWYYIGWMSLMAVIWYLGTAILMIFLTQFLFSKTMRRASDTGSTQTVKSLGYGLLYLIGVPVITIIAFIIVIGVPIGFILLFGYIITMALATVITSVIAANWFNTKYNHNWGTGKMVLTATGIFIVLKLLSVTVFLSWLVVVASLMAFGAILLNINWRRKEAI